MGAHHVKGGGGVELFVTDLGDKDAPTFLFIHGWAQSHICWQEQADLAQKYRLITFDLRGHGASDKPEDVAAYTDTTLWGEDVASIINTLDLKSPILVGSSYGSRVIASYLDTHGETEIAGVVLVGGLLAIGAKRMDWMVGPASPGMHKDLYSGDVARRQVATRDFVASCTFAALEGDLLNDLITANMQCPAHVRRALFAADWDFQSVYGKLAKPGLVIHGDKDAIVEPLTGITASELIAKCDLILYENAGHMPFLEQPDRFNADLSSFATTIFGAAP